MNAKSAAEMPHITVDCWLDGVTVSTVEYSLGHFPLSDSVYPLQQSRYRAEPL